MLTFHEAEAIARVYCHFQPLTSTCWRPLYWFLRGLVVHHSKDEQCSKYFDEYFESVQNDTESPTCYLSTLLRDSPYHRLTDFEDRIIYARAKVLYVYLNQPPREIKLRDVRVCPGIAMGAIKPLGDWDLVDNGLERYFWLDGEWIWYGKSKL